MSNWGIGLVISPGPGGRPEVLVLRDVEAHCQTCGKETVERFYEATSLHALTLPRLRALLDAGAPALAATCIQCGADVGPDAAVRWVVHYGFPGGRGLVQGFAERDGGRRWLLSPHRGIDVQLVPAWEADADRSNREVDALDDEALTSVFGRVLNPKEGARRWLARTAGDPTLRVHQLAPGTWIAAGSSDVDTDAARRAIDEAADGDGPWDTVTLVDGGRCADAWPHAPAEWLAGMDAALAGRRVVAACDRSRIAPALSHIITGFPVQMPVETVDAETLRLVLPDLGDWPDHPTIDARGLALEAARSLVAIDDMARVELDRLLYALTGLAGDVGEEAS